MAKKGSLSQEFISNSGSDSGDREEKPKPAKKRAAPAPVQKPAKKAKKESDDDEGGAEAGEVLRNDDGDAYIPLGHSKRVTIRKYKGTTLIDIRETYDKDGKTGLPGKKGISLTPALWDALSASVSRVNEAIANV